jgi:hypothetical protein
MKEIKPIDAKYMSCDAVVHDYGIYAVSTHKSGQQQMYNSAAEARQAMSNPQVAGTFIVVDERIGGLGTSSQPLPTPQPK